MAKVRDLSLAEQGRLKIEWAERHMPVLMKIREMFEERRPLKNVRIGACLHVTKETAVLVRTLQAGGAKVFLAASNPLSTQDDVAAALAEEGIEVFAWRGQGKDEYYWCLKQVARAKPELLIDDGGDLITLMHTEFKEYLRNVCGGQEETTTGVIRFRAMERAGVLKIPIVAVNDTPTKRMFDNVYGTGQSAIDGILRATNILLAGKTVVVAGYGYCGKGIARRARGMGARVIVTEVDPLKALQAKMDGFEVMRMIDAAKVGDVFITATGNRDVIRKEHFEVMKDGAILANAGHFNVEISVRDLEAIATKKRKVREHVTEYELPSGKRLYLLAEGRLVNLVAAEGHPSEVMDLSFSNQALVAEWLVKNGKNLKPRVYEVPREIDEMVARLKLEAMGVKIDELTPEQIEYLRSWKEGT